MSWALIAVSAMTGGAHGVLAATSDIAAVIEGGGIESVCVFDAPPGIHLWEGTFDAENDDYIGSCCPVTGDYTQEYLARHGEAP